MRYVSPRLNSKGLTYLYDECYETATVSGRYNVDNDVSRSEYDSFERYIREHLPSGGRLLDVGCGVGMLLQRFANDHTFSFEGCEYSEYAAERARSHSPAVHVGDLSELSLPPESYDGLSCLYVLEHVPDPLGVLREMYRLCAPGGHIFCAVPNYRYLRLRSDNAIVRAITRGGATLHAAEHLQNFSDATFVQSVETVGFEVTKRAYAQPLMTGSPATRIAKRAGAMPAELLGRFGLGLGGIHIVARRPK